MNKISNFFSNISINIKNFINAYPITIILVIILTIYYAIFPSFMLASPALRKIELIRAIAY